MTWELAVLTISVWMVASVMGALVLGEMIRMRDTHDRTN